MAPSQPDGLTMPSGAPTPGRAGGARRGVPRFRRARGMGGALGVVALSAVVPGWGFWWAGRRVLGLVTMALALATLVGAALYLPHDLRGALDFAFDPARLEASSVVLGVVLALWTLVLMLTFLMVRPVAVRRWVTGVGGVVVAALILAVAVPTAVASRYANVQAGFVKHVFENNQSATAPTDVEVADPWAGRDRVNVLLLGGDGGPYRDGVRTDSMILVSIDTHTGRAVSFSLPRNMMNVPFPEDSPLHDAFPNGFTGEGDPGNWMLNAVYQEVPVLHPHILGPSTNEGADAIKQAFEGATGLPVDYYVLINFQGFQQMVNAIGGITVNINEPVAVNGNTDAGVPPTRYLQPGPDQHLDGFDALWFARGRYGADDYQRMDRQRCVIQAIADRANPLNLLRNYQAVAKAGQQLVRTDIPRELLPAFVDLGLKVKEHRLKSVVFRRDDSFDPGAPDFTYVQDTVAKALAPRKHHAHRPAVEQDSKDACAYHLAGS
jgi:LCP family protein required for cell wall assembly